MLATRKLELATQLSVRYFLQRILEAKKRPTCERHQCSVSSGRWPPRTVPRPHCTTSCLSPWSISRSRSERNPKQQDRDEGKQVSNPFHPSPHHPKISGRRKKRGCRRDAAAICLALLGPPVSHGSSSPSPCRVLPTAGLQKKQCSGETEAHAWREKRPG
jgi:hypothetical protein